MPVNVLENNKEFQELLLWAQKEDKVFDFNSIDNGIPLQKKSLKFEKTGHANHPDYDKVIDNKIKDIMSNDILDEGEKFEEVQKLINNTKQKLEKDVLLGNKDVNQILDL
ncbi:AHH domain-containing protein [Flavobacterium sp. IMCC34518]|uniref:AHH domain-containing protein n=1 Tax=Flavobacterium sp. IMCC34518 TaxID=3003623 RepID=UPI002482AF5B|nr:AHH domain-containing protein [Flavobacterium sp. IMCC34518]